MHQTDAEVFLCTQARRGRKPPPKRGRLSHFPVICADVPASLPLRASLWSSCVVLPLLALTWMSAVLAMTDKRSILFQILFAVFDSLQGFVIVMVHCILRREVHRGSKSQPHPHAFLWRSTSTVSRLFFAGAGCLQMSAQKLPGPDQW